VGEVYVKANFPGAQPGEELMLNAEQVKAGMAYTYKKYAANCAQFEILEEMEREAQGQRRGVWGDPGAVKPWDYRKGQR
jgi:endonuclease YncB( thermonuclease family)